jgi:hypothetical protein
VLFIGGIDSGGEVASPGQGDPLFAQKWGDGADALNRTGDAASGSMPV